MTKRNIKLLQTIIGKLEALQHSIGPAPQTVRDRLGTAKTDLLIALRALEREAALTGR
jgi:hypothetical protein